MYNHKISVSNSHVNNKGKMKEVAIVNAIQDLEGLHIDSLTTFNNYLKEHNLGIFLLYRQIDIINIPTFAQTLTISTLPYNTSLIGGYRHIYINDELGKTMIQTNSFGAFVDLETYIPVRIPKNVVDSFPDGIKDTSIEDLPRKISYNNENRKLINKIKIKKSNIDRYNHVNNAYYIEFAIDSIEEEISFNRIRAEYKKSFQLNNTVLVYLTVLENNKYVVELLNELEELCAIIEFSTFL